MKIEVSPENKAGWFRAAVVLIVAAVSGYCGTVLLSGNTTSESAPASLTRKPGENENPSKTRPAESSILRDWNGERFDWPEPGEALLTFARKLPFGFARSRLLEQIIKNMPPGKAGDLLLEWDKRDTVALSLLTARLFSDPEKIAPSVAKAVFSNPQLTNFALKCLPAALDGAAGNSTARGALIRMLLDPEVSAKALRSRSVIDKLCKIKTFHGDLFKALSEPDSANRVPPTARESLFRALAGSDSPELAALLSAQPDSYLARSRAAQSLPQDLLAARRSVDEVLFEAGSVTAGRGMVAQALWKITKSDPERAVNAALESKDSEVSSELAFRLWTSWFRASPKNATAAAAAKGHAEWVQKAAGGAYFDEGP